MSFCPLRFVLLFLSTTSTDQHSLPLAAPCHTLTSTSLHNFLYHVSLSRALIVSPVIPPSWLPTTRPQMPQPRRPSSLRQPSRLSTVNRPTLQRLNLKCPQDPPRSTSASPTSSQVCVFLFSFSLVTNTLVQVFSERGTLLAKRRNLRSTRFGSSTIRPIDRQTSTPASKSHGRQSSWHAISRKDERISPLQSAG